MVRLLMRVLYFMLAFPSIFLFVFGAHFLCKKTGVNDLFFLGVVTGEFALVISVLLLYLVDASSLAYRIVCRVMYFFKRKSGYYNG